MNTAPKLLSERLLRYSNELSGPSSGELVALLREAATVICDLSHDAALVRQSVEHGWAAAALAPPSGGGVGTLNVWRHVGGDDGECEYHFSGKIPPGDYVIVPAKNTTPQSAPVDGETRPIYWMGEEVKTTARLIEIVKEQCSAAIDYVLADDTTPPPASQERGGQAAIAALREIADAARDVMATELGEIACFGSDAPCEYALGLLKNKLFNYKEIVAAASPPSSAAEASINSPEIDSKLIPDAAEQAKPVACDCGNDFIECFGSDERGWWVGCKPCSKRDGGREHVKGRSREEAVRKWNAILRRLAGGVMVDDVMVERAIIGAMAQARRDGVAMGDQRWDGSFPTRTMWRAALVAALSGGKNG